MWRKSILVLGTLLLFIPTIFFMSNHMLANTQSMAIGQEIAMKLGEAGIGPNGPGSLTKGDKVALGLSSSQTIGMQILSTTTPLGEGVAFSISTESIGKSLIFNDADPLCGWTTAASGAGMDPYLNTYFCSEAKPVVKTYNDAIVANSLSDKIIQNRYYQQVFHRTSNLAYPHMQQDPDETRFFVPFYGELNVFTYMKSTQSFSQMGITADDLAFHTPYLTPHYGSASGKKWFVIDENGQLLYVPYNGQSEIRIGAYLDMKDVVFATSSSNGSELRAKVIPNTKYAGSGELYELTKSDPELKLRIASPDMNATLTDLKTDKGQTLKIKDNFYMIEHDKTILLEGEANANNSKVSVLLFNAVGELTYYQPLENAKGLGTYSFDLKDLPVGDYHIAIVNEQSDSNSLEPVKSSLLSDVKKLRIVESQQSYTKTPQAGASEENEYEYTKNTNCGDVIGTINKTNAVGPIKYELINDDNNTGAYENFEIVGLDANGTSEATSLQVRVKSAGGPNINETTNSLTTGAYNFCILATDANFHEMKTCTSMTVSKTQPTITFKTQDKGTEQIEGSVSTGVDSIQHATHDNQDIIANGGNDHKILYTQDSGTAGLFTGLPKTMDSGGEITITTVANKTGEITLKAHIDETENYLSADTTKTLKVVLGMNPEYVEDKMNIKAGSSEAKPSTTVPIGHISVSGGTSPFTYAFKTGANQNGSFKLDASTGKIYVDASVGNSGLTPGEYTIEVEVTDSTSPTKQKKTVTKKITIQEADLEGVAFEDPDTAGTQAGSTITRTYDPANDGGTFRTKLFETTKGSLTGTTITYSVDPASNAVLEYTKKEGEYAYFKVKKGSSASEKGTILIKANVKGGAYGAAGKDITIPVNVDPYTQEIEFKQDDPYSIANTASCTSIPATKKSDYWNQDDASNTITYTSSDPSKITIDEDGKICPVKDATGTIILSATLAGDDSYKEAKSTITINLIPELEGAYIEDKTNIIAGSKEAKPSTTTKIGHFTATGGTSGYTYAKKQGTNDNDKFDIKASGDVFVSTGAGANGLLPGDYTIEVEITDSTTPTAQTTTYKKTITIKPAALSVKFEDPDDSSKTIENVITRTYDPSTTPAGGSFHTKLVETEKGSLTGAKIDYSVEADPNDVVEYVDMSGDYANFKVKKASDASEKNQIKIKAHVSGGYYGSEGTDITILVNVEQYKQEIEFKQTNPYPLPNTSECTSIPATKKSSYWNQSASNEIKYTSSDITKATIDADGKVCPVKGATGSITLTAELAGDDNYAKASTTIKINLLGELTLTYTEDTPVKQAVNPDKTGDTGNAKDGAEFGSISVAGGLDKRYNIQIKSDDYAHDYFEFVPITGNQRASTLKLKSGVSITADILKVGIDAGVIEQDTTNKDQYNWTMQVLPDTGEEPQEIIVHIIGADPILTFEKEVDGKLTTTFEEDGTIDLSIKRGDSVMNAGISVEGPAIYKNFIKDVSGFTTDAQLNGTGIVKANCDDDDHVIGGKDFKLTPKAEASDGYKSGTGTATPVIIKKADHPDIDFEDPDTILSSYVQSVDKGFTGILTDDEHLEITPQGESTWTGTSFTKEDKGDTTEPSVTITPNGFEGTITYVVNGGGTSNYKPIENKEIHLAFAQEGGISYKPIKITYGDDTKKVIDYISDADKAKNTYTYAPVDGSKYINDAGEELFTLNTDSTITTIQVGKTKVSVTRIDEHNNSITQAIPVEIIPKEITLTYESNIIYTGEALPTPVFKEPETGVLVGNDTIADFPIPNEAAHYDGNDVLIDSETTGTYDTKGNWTNDELATDVNPNYKVTIKTGKLTIKKDTVKDNWYHLEDPEGNTVSKTSWHNYIVDVVLDTATGTAGTYDQISNTKTFTDTDKTRFTVTDEDENTEDVYFRIDPDSEVEHKGAITSTQTTVKIDMSDPLITSITGYPVNDKGLSELINNLTFGIFYKPGIEILIETKDPQPSGETGRVVSGVNTVSYKIYKLGEKGEFDSNQTPKTGEGKVDANGKISFKINDVGNYRICAIAKDNATNTGRESCSDVNIKKIDEDIDGDGEPDFNDSDKDGCPDLNIVLGTDKDGNKIKLNVAEKGKKYPYMNIDSNGDGKPDLNIDTDNDGRPDLNLVIMDESLWKPKTCVVVDKLKDYSDPVEYCTGTDAKPQINVDTTGNGIPNINIDNKGDFQAHINISKNGEDAYLNITPIHIWKPDQNYNKDTLLYDSIGEDIKAITNIDSNNDGIPDLNLDFIGDGIPSVNIDTDGDGIPDLNIDGNGDGKPDYNVDTKGTGKDLDNPIKLDTWEPIHIGERDELTFGTMEIKNKDHLEDQGVIVEKPNGNFLPNFALKVEDITITAGKDIKDALAEHAQEKQIQGIYRVSLTENGEQVEPGESLTVRIPVDKSLRNPSIMIQKKDGNYVAVNAQIKDGYYVFETDYLGVVAVLSDTDVKPAPEEPDKPSTVLPSPDSGGTSNAPDTSVQGTYTSGVGGASTGDAVHPAILVLICGIALLIVSFMYRYSRKQ